MACNLTQGNQGEHGASLACTRLMGYPHGAQNRSGLRSIPGLPGEHV